MHGIEKTARLTKSNLANSLFRMTAPIRKVLHAGGKFYCPVCTNNARRFLDYGTPTRANARCPVCGSLERHRLDWTFLEQRSNLFDGLPKSMLHVAPEPFLATRFQKLKGLHYVSVDIDGAKAMMKMDLTDITFSDSTFSAIYCSHVLEHISDDRKALSELFRVLKPNGWAILQVPITAKATYEDPSVTTPAERTRHFGQWDHVRRCGPDYATRMSSTGFSVDIVRSEELSTTTEQMRMGLPHGKVIFFCTKPGKLSGTHSSTKKMTSGEPAERNVIP